MTFHSLRWLAMCCTNASCTSSRPRAQRTVHTSCTLLRGAHGRLTFQTKTGAHAPTRWLYCDRGAAAPGPAFRAPGVGVARMPRSAMVRSPSGFCSSTSSSRAVSSCCTDAPLALPAGAAVLLAAPMSADTLAPPPAPAAAPLPVATRGEAAVLTPEAGRAEDALPPEPRPVCSRPLLRSTHSMYRSACEHPTSNSRTVSGAGVQCERGVTGSHLRRGQHRVHAAHLAIQLRSSVEHALSKPHNEILRVRWWCHELRR